jgi:hypothetical protein
MGRSMASSSSQRQLFLAMVWLSVTAALAISVQTLGINSAFGDNGQPVGEGIALDYPLAGPNVSKGNGPSELYAGLLWTVTGTRVTPADGFMGRATVEVDLQIANTLQVTGLRTSVRTLTLVSADGNTVTTSEFADIGPRLSFEPGETKSATVSFEVGFASNPDLANLTLRIAEPSRTPALIPLGGTPQTPTQPIVVAVDTTVKTPVTDPDRAGSKLVVTPDGAVIDVNAGPYRALEGQRLAVVKVALQRTEATTESSFLTPGFWSLDTSAGSMTPVLVAKGQAVAANADEITLVFAFPADAQNLTLVAARQADAARFPLVLPAAS